MANASKVKINVTDRIEGVSQPVAGVSFFMGPTKRGPVFDPKDVITSWPQFVRIFGGEVAGLTFPTYMRRYFESGGSARICRVTSHNTSTGDNNAEAATTVAISNGDASATLFSVKPKYVGADSNNLAVEIKAASNGEADYFDMSITHKEEPELNEYYRNLTIFGDPQNLPYTNPTFLEEPIRSSQLVDFVYATIASDLSDKTIKISKTDFAGGTDGSDAITATDYIGDTAKNPDWKGFTAFDNYSEAYHIAAPGIYDASLHIAGAAYAAKRRDLFYFAELAPTNKTTTTITAAREAITATHQFLRVFYGELGYTKNGADAKCGSLADICSKAVLSELEFNPWVSFSGKKRGVLTNVNRVITNFGSPSSSADLDLLANDQINPVVMRSGTIYLTGNFTGLNQNKQEQWANVTKLIMYLRKTLLPTLENYLEEPNDITTWSTIYYNIKPFMDGLMTGQYRAIYDYTWEGDQFVNSLDDLQINRKDEVLQGKYRVSLTIVPIPSMQEFTLNILLDANAGAAQIV